MGTSMVYALALVGRVCGVCVCVCVCVCGGGGGGDISVLNST